MSETAGDSPIRLEHVTRRFGKMLAVNDLTLSIPRATTFGFIGLNGAGKTTAIRMMVGLLAPSSGSIHVDGIEVPRDRDRVKTHIGYVPDRPNVYPWMRVEEAISFVRSFQPKWNQARCDELMKMFELDPRKRAKHLSKGQAAKLSMLLAICHDPAVLIFDEPTSGLDPLVREEFLEGVLSVTSERQQTVLFSSHTLSDVQRLADNIGIMHEGKLLLHAPVDELLDRTKRIRAVLEEENGKHEAPPGMVFQRVRGREWMITVENFRQEQIEFVRSRNRISHLDVQDMSLDDVFKDFVRGQKEAV
ncbi:MAG TPA: ABC transporter ATP-binding protein [Tepidisphaeraceae bacterium]|jgi:ABC-2 type transport system ATP-binding protein|nr:ABC transporter ATP-binding protein [Tepidisphaeraceae bacterium]